MFEILEQSTSSTIGFKVAGKVSSEDYTVLLERIDKAISENEKINLLVLVEDFDGWDDLEAAKADYRFGREQYRHVERCAFVSDKNWHKWAIKVLDPFTRRTDEKFFEPEELDEAWQWCQGND
ncbi:MAG: STAS/SEC14 domain-containing protein [Anaerolineales bacterium]|nr:STAS/SEC14 domain-containing protein [Anaerolineales bacterium]